MIYSPTLVVHICGGTLGLLSGTAAICFRKGSLRHVLAGRVFVVSMLIMAVGAIWGLSSISRATLAVGFLLSI